MPRRPRPRRTRSHRLAVNHEAAVAIDNAAHGEDVGYRFALKPVCVQRAGAHGIGRGV
jgi:hypothetical protein